VSEELGEIIVDKETARASYVTLRSVFLLTCLLTYVSSGPCGLVDWSFGCHSLVHVITKWLRLRCAHIRAAYGITQCYLPPDTG